MRLVVEIDFHVHVRTHDIDQLIANFSKINLP